MSEELTGFDSIISDCVSKMAQDFAYKKEIIIKEKIKEIIGIEVDVKEEMQRRFKRFCTVRQGNEETIYFDDGSIEGKRIVTFVKNDIPLDTENFTLGYEETYY